MFQKKTTIPGPTFLEYLDSFSEPRLKQLLNLSYKYGDLVKFPGIIRSFLINHVDTVGEILRQPQAFNKKNAGYWRLARFLGDGLLVSEDDVWKKRRRLLQPIFHRQLLKEATPLVVDSTISMIEQWQSRYIPQKQKFNMTKEMLTLVLSISSKMIFNEDLDNQVSDIIKWTTRAHRIVTTSIIINRFVPTWNSIQFYHALENMEKLARNLIHKRKNNMSDKSDLLNLMLNAQDEETGEKLSEAAIINEIKTFLVTGHETAGYALTWIFSTLIKHPEILERVTQEVQSVLGDRKATFDDVAKLEYTRRVIEETLRIYPPIWVFTRKNVEDLPIDGYKIPARSNLIICPYILHRHPAHWPSPEKFDPDRFLPENVAKRPKMSYLPFGAGPRVCIAGSFAMMKLPLIIATVLQRVDIQSKTKRALVPNPQYSLKLKRPFWVSAVLSS